MSMEGAGALGAIHTARLRRRMMLAFALTVAVLLSLGLSISVALVHLRRTTTEILATQTRSIRLLSRLRGVRESGRHLGEEVVLGRVPSSLQGQLLAAEQAFATEASQFEALVSEPEQIESWANAQAIHRRFWLLLKQGVNAAQAGDTGLANTFMVQALAADQEATLADEDLVRIDARRADGLAKSADRQVYGVGVFTLLAMALAVVATLTLLRQALVALGAYANHMSLRLEDLDLFAGRVVHDIRQPLTSLSLMLSTVQRSVDDPRLLAALGRGTTLIQRLSRMAEDLLNFSRSGLIGEHAVTTTPQDVVLQVLEETRAQPAAAGIEWKLDLSPAVIIPMGAGYLHMVLWNLVDNAVKYTSTSATKCITVRLEQHGHEAVIVIRDSGPGIAEDRLGKVFQPFYRGTAVGSGYGLGLATVKRLVHAHGGRIEILSAVGHGTQFCISFSSGGGVAKEVE